MAVKGCQCSMYFNLDFDVLAELLELETEEVYELWNTGKLEEKLAELDIEVLIHAMDFDVYGGINVGSGYLS